MPRTSMLSVLRAALTALLLLCSSPGIAQVARADTQEAAAGTPALRPLVLDGRFGVAEGFRDPRAMADIGAGWERVVLSWADVQPDGPGDFSWLGRTLPEDRLNAELRRGVRVV